MEKVGVDMHETWKIYLSENYEWTIEQQLNDPDHASMNCGCQFNIKNNAIKIF